VEADRRGIEAAGPGRQVVHAALAAAAAPAAAQVTLNASSWVPPGHPLTAGLLVPLCADFDKATAGRVKCNVLPKAPVNATQTIDGVKDGLMDLSFIVNGYTPGRFSLSDAPEFPFMGDTSEVTSVAYQRVYDRMLAKANEYKDVVLLGVFTHGPGQIYNTKRPINSLKDLEGLKIRIGGGLVNEIAKAVGPFELCHCSRCRKASGSAFAAMLGVEAADYRLVSGAELIASWDAPILRAPPAYRSSFCRRCGSVVPAVLPDWSDTVFVPAGNLEGDPGIRPELHMFAASGADWFPITDALLAGLLVSIVVNDTPSDVLGVGAAAAFTLWRFEQFRSHSSGGPG